MLLRSVLARLLALVALATWGVCAAAAETYALGVGDRLRVAIQGQPEFQESGRFSDLRDEGWLRSQGYSPGAFEFDLRYHDVRDPHALHLFLEGEVT